LVQDYDKLKNDHEALQLEHAALKEEYSKVQQELEHTLKISKQTTSELSSKCELFSKNNESLCVRLGQTEKKLRAVLNEIQLHCLLPPKCTETLPLPLRRIQVQWEAPTWATITSSGSTVDFHNRIKEYIVFRQVRPSDAILGGDNDRSTSLFSLVEVARSPHPSFTLDYTFADGLDQDTIRLCAVREDGMYGQISSGYSFVLPAIKVSLLYPLPTISSAALSALPPLPFPTPSRRE